ncbi:MAG: helix-turn-helix domain-containing protein [Cellvibrionaceae bacterium]|nr:helix-turn-helix domain-containing protein [Cellvibrionaceae bacterium]
MLKIVFLLCDNMLASSVTLPMEMLRAAEQLQRGHGQHRRQPPLDIVLVSKDGASVASHTGIKILAEQRAADIASCDMLFVPALWRNPRPIIHKHRELLPWLKQLHNKNAIIAGVGTGCWLLAESGILDNKPATTHWYYFDDFQQCYPAVQLKRAHFITQAGQTYCAASVNSFAELTVHFIDIFFGRAISLQVERHFFHEIRDAYKGSRTFMDAGDTHQDEDIIQAQLWLRQHHAETISIKQLSENMNMPQRTLNRRFKKATGQTPLEYLHSIRLNVARDLLKNTNLSIGDIVYQVGYQDGAYFGNLFKSYFGTSAQQYRVTVRGKLFSLCEK